MNLTDLKTLAEAATHTPEGQWHWNDKYGELCYKSEADDQTYMMSCPLPLNESNSKFIAAANPETILALIALLQEMGEALGCVAYDEEGYIMNADAEEVYAKYEEMTNGN